MIMLNDDTLDVVFVYYLSFFYLEIPDFLSPEEADHIIDVAYGVGFSKSDIHLDPVAKDHAKTLRSTEGNEKTVTWTDRLVVNSIVINRVSLYSLKVTRTAQLVTF